MLLCAVSVILRPWLIEKSNSVSYTELEGKENALLAVYVILRPWLINPESKYIAKNNSVITVKTLSFLLKPLFYSSEKDLQ